MVRRLTNAAAKIRSFLSRPAAYGALGLSYAGVIAAVSYAAATGASSQEAVRTEALREVARNERIIERVDREAENRQREICGVIINSHEAARDDLQRLNQSIQSTRRFIAQADENAPILARFARQNLPRTIAARNTTRERVKGLTPPKTCRIYIRSER